MSNKQFAYIISNYKFHKHWKLSKAKKEKLRLEALFPEEIFRIYWVRAKINKSGDCVALLPKENPQPKSIPIKGKPILKLKPTKKRV